MLAAALQLYLILSLCAIAATMDRTHSRKTIPFVKQILVMHGASGLGKYTVTCVCVLKFWDGFGMGKCSSVVLLALPIGSERMLVRFPLGSVVLSQAPRKRNQALFLS